MAAAVAAKAFGKPLVETLYEFLAKYESANCHNRGAGVNPKIRTPPCGIALPICVID
jgi:hypothetical protein